MQYIYILYVLYWFFCFVDNNYNGIIFNDETAFLNICILNPVLCNKLVFPIKRTTTGGITSTQSTEHTAFTKRCEPIK